MSQNQEGSLEKADFTLLSQASTWFSLITFTQHYISFLFVLLNLFPYQDNIANNSPASLSVLIPLVYISRKSLIQKA